MSETIRICTEQGTVERKVRRTRQLPDGTHIGWVSFEGRDRKVTKTKRKKTWCLVESDVE